MFVRSLLIINQLKEKIMKKIFSYLVVVISVIFVFGAIASQEARRYEDLKVVCAAYDKYHRGELSEQLYNNICDLRGFNEWRTDYGK